MTIKHWNSRKVITVRERNGRFTENKPVFRRFTEWELAFIALFFFLYSLGFFLNTVIPVAHAQDFNLYSLDDKGMCQYAKDRHLVAIGHEKEFKRLCAKEGITLK